LCYSLNFCASLLDFRFGNFWNYLEPSWGLIWNLLLNTIWQPCSEIYI
jgi:hypothetical protein